ncbi:MAG: phosphatase PAP2 family protein, partial [Bacteroidota bacterium]|nr:phosphatase PAP2 family protein [Bacteroidota bacterium]
IGLSTIFGLYGITVKDYKAINTGSQILEGFVTTGLMVQLVKHVAGRERPTAMSKPSGRWDIFPNQKNYFKSITHYDSFCSGHFASAFTTYIILTENYPNSSAIKLIGIPALGALSVSLVSKGMHWPSDFPLSMLLGYTFGQVVTGSHLHPDNNISSNIIPILSLNQIGKKLGLNFVWKL